LGLIFRNDNLQKEVHIALVGKYTQLEDSYASVTKALQHSAIASGYRLKLKVQHFLFNLDQDYRAWVQGNFHQFQINTSLMGHQFDSLSCDSAEMDAHSISLVLLKKF
jgi:CTP synthase (UTP-ammonia lyase)